MPSSWAAVTHRRLTVAGENLDCRCCAPSAPRSRLAASGRRRWRTAKRWQLFAPGGTRRRKPPGSQGLSLARTSAPQKDGLPSRTSIAVDTSAHALPGPLRSRRQRRLGAGRPARPRRRPDDGWRAQAGRRARKFGGRNIGRIGDVEIGQRQRAGLVEDDGVDFGQPLDRIAGIEQHAGAEHGARSDGLHRRDGKPERAGTGDDQNRDRGDDGIMPATRRTRPSPAWSEARWHAPPAHRAASARSANCT